MCDPTSVPSRTRMQPAARASAHIRHSAPIGLLPAHVTRRHVLATMALLVSARAAAQPPAWLPDRPVRLVIPFGAGGSTDITGRIFAEALSARLGQPVVVDNRPGAGGSIATEYVARAAPDGTTLILATSTTQVTNPWLYRHLPYDVVRDFAPISLTAFIPNLLVCAPGLPVRDIPELIALAKARPDALSYGSSGPGSSQHLAGALLATRTGTRMTHVPYRGGGQVVADLLAGNIQLYFSPMAETIDHVRVGRLRALAVTTARRTPLLPDIPTVADTIPGYEIRLWNGLLAPAGTPPAAITAIAGATADMLRDPAMRAKLAQQGSEPVGSGPEEFAGFIAAELPKWAELVRLSGATVE